MQPALSEVRFLRRIPPSGTPPGATSDSPSWPAATATACGRAALYLVDVLLEAVNDRQVCTWWTSCCSGRPVGRCDQDAARAAARDRHRSGQPAAAAPAQRTWSTSPRCREGLHACTWEADPCRRLAALGRPAAAADGAGAPRRPGAHAGRIQLKLQRVETPLGPLLQS